jgi:hypothetical protein
LRCWRVGLLCIVRLSLGRGGFVKKRRRISGCIGR